MMGSRFTGGRAALALLLMAAAPLLGKAADTPPAVIAGPGKPYRPAKELDGKLRIVGSTTLSHLATIWGEGLRRFHPKLKIDVDCKGSETAFDKLDADELTVAAFSRPLSPAEVKKAASRLKKKVIVVTVCEDLIAVVVHKDNPVKALTMAQLRALFSDEKKDTPKWGQVGLKGDWEKATVELHGRDTSSGTHSFFRSKALKKDDKERKCKAHPSNQAVAEAVAANTGAIGYCRMMQARGGVKAVQLATSEEEAKLPRKDEVAFGPGYPLRRQLFLLIAVPEKKPIPPILLDYLLFALSRDGQQDAQRDGFLPLTRPALLTQFDRLGISRLK
jgi:phosphate transport system substrate-binding protein